jgi:Helicase associated domain
MVSDGEDFNIPGPGTPDGGGRRVNGRVEEVARAQRLEHAVGRLSAAEERADDAGFARGLAALTAYADTHGHTRIPDDCRDPTGFPLTAWVAEQRRAYLEGELAPSRRAALERITGWHWEPSSTHWDSFGKDRA